MNKTRFFSRTSHTRYISQKSYGTACQKHLTSIQLAPTISQCLQLSRGNKVKVSGWIRGLRKQKTVAFARITDGSSSTTLQVVMDPEKAANLDFGSAVCVEGILVESKGKEQSIELQAENIALLGKAGGEEYPLQKKDMTTDYLRQFIHLRTRTDYNSCIMRVRGNAMRAIHDFFKKYSFLPITTPILTSIDCEGAGEMFQVKCNDNSFFTKPSYLSVSGQLHAEALALSHSRVYTFSPAFRAEPSITSRHLSEFWMLEAEYSFVNNLEEVLDLVQVMIRDIIMSIVHECKEDLKVLDMHDNSFIQQVVNQPFTRITYEEAIIFLNESQVNFDFLPRYGAPLQSEHERFLAKTYGPIFVTDFPQDLKPFYMRINDDNKTVGCFDLLFPGIGELIGGSLREERINKLEAVMNEKGLDKKDYEWYLDLRKYAGVPHAGFGMGFDRLLMFITGAKNIREVSPFPRWINHVPL